jgi:hypothetical protein
MLSIPAYFSAIRKLCCSEKVSALSTTCPMGNSLALEQARVNIPTRTQTNSDLMVLDFS